MTRDDFIRISKERAKGIAIGVALVLLVGAIVFWPRVQKLPDAEPEVAFTGVPDTFREEAAEAFAAYPMTFETAVPGIAEQDNSRKNIRLWEAMTSFPWPGPQKTGDCVGCGVAPAVRASAAVKARRNGVEPPGDDVFPCYPYGIARVQIGNGYPPCGKAGADPSQAARGFEQFGWLLTSEARDLGYTYSGKLSDEWGCRGPARDAINIAKKRAGGSCYPIRSVDEWRDAICNGYGVTVAFPFRQDLTVFERDGRWVVDLSSGDRLGNHQVCSLGYDGSTGREYFWIQNSHGANWPSSRVQHLNGEPPGGCWITREGAEWIVTKNRGVLWAYSVSGFEAEELDLRIFDGLRLSQSSPVPPVLAP
jgi:hypothetical protein